MSVTRQNPLPTEVRAELSPALEDRIKELYKRVEEANNSRTEWYGKQEKLYRQRRGVRKKKIFPWPGANNHNWPLTDGVIRHWKPGMTGLILQADPVCWFFPQNQRGIQAQPTAQAYYHWRFHSINGVERTAMELLDYIGQHGLAFTRQGWDYKTEKKCRVIRVDTLFPQGWEAAVEEYNAQVRQAQAEAQQMIASGQAPPETMQNMPKEMDPVEFLTTVLEQEYVVKADNPMEGGQIAEAVQAIMQGAQVVKLFYRVIRRDKPGWKAYSPMDVILPPRLPMSEIGDAPYIAFLHRFSADDLLGMAKDGHFNMEVAMELAEDLQTRAMGVVERDSGIGSHTDAWRHSIQTILDKSDGISPGTQDEPTVDTFLEIYCKLDLDGDGIEEKCVLWYCPRKHKVLALDYYRYPFWEWPITAFEFEVTSDRIYSSRGIAELLSTFQAQSNKQHNSRLDAMQILLAPMLQMRATAMDAKRNIRFMPGTVIPVQTVGDIAPIQQDVSVLLQSFQEENYVRQLAEQYVGIFDPTVLAQNAPERRTAAEVDAVTSRSQSVFGQDATLFQVSMKKVHEQLWELEREFGPQQLVYRVTGEQLPRLASKAEIDENFDLVPSGTPANTSKQLAVSRAREAIQMFWPDQSGTIDKNALAKYYFSVMDRNMGNLIVRPPEQAAAIQQLLSLVQELSGGKVQPVAF